MSRTFTIKELNEKIDELQEEYKDELRKLWGEENKIAATRLLAKIEALEDLKLELNSPEPIVNVTEKIQESLNIIETNKIIKDGL